MHCRCTCTCTYYNISNNNFFALTDTVDNNFYNYLRYITRLQCSVLWKDDGHHERPEPREKIMSRAAIKNSSAIHPKFFITIRHIVTTLCLLYRPQNLLIGMNKFLESLDITFRRDPNNFRPRINKLHSVKV